MPGIPFVGFVLQALGAVALALMLSSFERKGPRPGVRDWALGLWFLAASLLAAVLGSRVPVPLRGAVRAAEFVLAYWSTSLVLLGTLSRWQLRERPGARRWLLAAFALLGIATGLAGSLAPWGVLLRMTTYSLVALVAHLSAGVLLLRSAGARAVFGTRVLAVSFLGQAAEDALFLCVAATGARGSQLVPSADHLVEAEMLLLMLMGIGMVAWLLEGESESAVALQQVLHRKESLSAMGTLVAGVAHEVRNPLFAISATVDALVARTGSGGAGATHLGILQEQTRRLSQLMRDLLDYGRPIASELAPGPLPAVAARAIAACAAVSQQAGVSVELDKEPAASLVRMDEPRLQQVFQNLVQNGVEMTPRGGRVWVGVQPEQRHGQPGVRCDVRDSGPGFDAASLPQVFEPFFSRRQGGTGLGLSIVRRIVEQHAGDVEAANHPTGGGVVSVWLPAAGPSAGAAAHPR